ncbi:RNA polymerase sigma factor SigA [Hyella patelloides LEGE 07179]|uniref:RNA polymerase sigma factor SigA n=1 Tax=Hyella patelloides LEGE 07179 TaxID=945734 RepID=A0A563VXK3_9CYAN|nr:sigma-70 family RNA polymerase sigma factor [Hyella patelloides]VEP16184.1 RNA polymerase sigma factor SigA [Hyella patelloides LEGE 07179]
MVPSNSVIKNPDQSTDNLEFALDRNDPSQITKKQTTGDKKQLAKIKSGYSQIQTQNNKHSQDPVRNYLQDIGRIPLLSGEEEIKLSRQVADLLELEQIRQQLAEKLGRQPSDREWAQETNMILSEFRHRLYLSRQAKNKMVQANLRLVVFIAKKYLKRGLSLQDLIQEGNLGLIRAVEKFEPEKGCKFSTYAYWWIRQSITRAISEQSRTIRLPIHIYDKLSLIKKTFKLLSQKLQRHPNEVEMAEHLNITVEQLRFLLRVAQEPFSLEIPVAREEDSRLLGESIESELPTPEEWIVKKLIREEVETILSCLNYQERTILRLRYGLNDEKIKTSAEIAQMLNLSREEINQIRGRAMNKLRRLYRNSGSKEYLF